MLATKRVKITRGKSGRLKVRDRLRQMLEVDQQREPDKRQHRLLERSEFDRLCDEVGGVSDKEALLDFLHHNGVVFLPARTLWRSHHPRSELGLGSHLSPLRSEEDPAAAQGLRTL